MSKDFLDLEINGKSYKLPTSWDSLTLEQYCRAFYKLKDIDDIDDEVDKFRQLKKNESIILSRLMGESDDFCLDLPWNVYEKLAHSISFIYSPSDFIKNAKASIIIDGKRFTVPPLDKMSLRQFIDADVVMKEDSPIQYIELLSVLLLSKDDKGEYIPYDGNSQVMVDKLSKLSCSTCVPFVMHFFKKSFAYKKLSEASMKVEGVKLQRQHTVNS